jgi:protein TonB
MEPIRQIDNKKSGKTHFGISIVLHAVFLLFLLFIHLFNPTIEVLPDRPEETIYVEDRRDRPEIEKVKQIVESEDALNREEPEKGYLGERTQKVARETKAAKVSPFKKAPSSVTGSQSELSKIALKTDLRPLGHVKPEQRTGTEESASTSDYLKNISLGAQTLLNTREYAYFTFYQRVRRQLEQYWEPGLRKRLYQMVNRGRTIASGMELATKLVVTLDTAGSITKVQIEDTSGVLDLDDAAVDAFNKAGPFPNPPNGIVGVDGKIRIEWEFILKT